jgi:hypothetical protein
MNTRVNETSHFAVGLCFMLLGGALLLDRLGLIPIDRSIQFWPIALVLVGGAMMVQAARGRSDAGQGKTAAPIGALIWLLIIGFFVTAGFRRDRTVEAVAADGSVRVIAIMGRDERTNLSEPFQRGRMTSVMGRAELDLRNATLQPGEQAVLRVASVMGAVIVHVPEGWDVDVRVTPIMGGVKNARRGPLEADWESTAPAQGVEPVEPVEAVESPAAKPRLLVRGVAFMGGVEIRN